MSGCGYCIQVCPTCGGSGQITLGPWRPRPWPILVGAPIIIGVPWHARSAARDAALARG